MSCYNAIRINDCLNGNYDYITGFWCVMLHYASPENVNILCFRANKSLRFLFCSNILKNKGSLMMVPWRTLKIHGIFSFHKRFFIVEKGSIDYSDILHSKKKMVLLKTVHWKVLWGPKILLLHHHYENPLWPYQDITRNLFCVKSSVNK